MFSQADFDVFLEPTLTGRMAQVRAVIDPQFEQLAANLQPFFSQQKIEIYPHIAKHLRRTVNPPINTWIAFGPNKRGYKKDPHFEIGFWADRMFIWLALLGESKIDAQISSRLLANQQALNELTGDYYVCQDHTQTKIEAASAKTIEMAISGYQRGKKDEFLIGQVWAKDDRFFQNSTAIQIKSIEAVISGLLAIYQKLVQ
ncbi:DUF1054 family protein [Paucilactobacillus wasatchensis]|uniref:Uncharacterized protein n=1 Tax=Paucilactobacillus wasatchensis TaxID=1335616 RepID=A0A0D1A950_9LACO|nr:DUF1054 family protein [Paucilactobacillus wasatchensis]KIS04217.1 hypothetical protein WDC_0148 [Paucilactobacillus wasatchensis]